MDWLMDYLGKTHPANYDIDACPCLEVTLWSFFCFYIRFKVLLCQFEPAISYCKGSGLIIWIQLSPIKDKLYHGQYFTVCCLGKINKGHPSQHKLFWQVRCLNKFSTTHLHQCHFSHTKFYPDYDWNCGFWNWREEHLVDLNAIKSSSSCTYSSSLIREISGILRRAFVFVPRSRAWSRASANSVAKSYLHKKPG